MQALVPSNPSRSPTHPVAAAGCLSTRLACTTRTNPVQQASSTSLYSTTAAKKAASYLAVLALAHFHLHTHLHTH